MGAIIPFVARVRDSGDWTSGERAKLDALADHFAALGASVEVVYGVTDDGDPWCVIKDENEDVLIHVARIGDRFVVHYAADDSLAEAPDLPSALGERLMGLEAADDEHVVVPFAVGGRQAQMLIALVAATAFFYETRDAHAQTAPEPQAAPLPEEPADAVVVAAVALEGSAKVERATTNHSGALGDPESDPAAGRLQDAEAEAAPLRVDVPAAAEAPPPLAPDTPVHAPPPALQPPPQEETVVADRGQTLAGGEGADLIRGGDGADTLSGGGAPAGAFDTLDGGAGDDRIEVDAQVVAIGGAGADTFVIQAPAHFGDADVFLGFIADFHAAEGDRLEGHDLKPLAPVAPPPGAEARVHPPEPPPGVFTAETSTVFVDLNGDGRADGFLVMGVPPGAAPAEPDHGDFAGHGATIGVPGLGFPHPDIGG